MLALPAARQQAWLGSLGPGASVDELALDFDDGYRLLPQWVEAGWIPSTSMRAFAAIDEALSAISDSPDAGLWTLDALRTRPEWARLRDLAAAALLSI